MKTPRKKEKQQPDYLDRLTPSEHTLYQISIFTSLCSHFYYWKKLSRRFVIRRTISHNSPPSLKGLKSWVATAGSSFSRRLISASQSRPGGRQCCPTGGRVIDRFVSAGRFVGLVARRGRGNMGSWGMPILPCCRI